MEPYKTQDLKNKSFYLIIFLMCHKSVYIYWWLVIHVVRYQYFFKKSRIAPIFHLQIEHNSDSMSVL